MQEIFRLIIGILVLTAGFFIGNILARYTKEELKQGQFWFKAVIFLSFIGAVVSFAMMNDTLLFTFLFIAIVVSRSLKSPKK
ncbi:MAG: hypothetical protein ABH804_00940 [archaeon]